MHQRRHRRRRRLHGVAEEKKPLKLGKLISTGLLLLLLFVLGSRTLNFFGVGNTVRSAATILKVEDRGLVNVSVEGGPMKQAENDLKLYPGDRIVSSPNNRARLYFFDETLLRMDESTQVLIQKTTEGEEHSTISVALEEGTVFVVTSDNSTFSGSILRTISSNVLEVQLAPGTEAVMSERSLTVYQAEGLGLEVTVAGNKQSITIGEGQTFTIPEGSEKAYDLYTYRNPVDGSLVQSPFVQSTRESIFANITEEDDNEEGEEGTEAPSPPQNTPLTVTTPEDGTELQTATVKVRGSIGPTIDKVRVNGYMASVDATTQSFEIELALPEEDEVNITVEALDESGVTVAESIRTVIRDTQPPEPPTITSPAGNGTVYKTTQTKLEISGTAPKGAVGILVNGYRLQLFKPTDTTWSYLANVEYDNYSYGENTFEVVALNRGGYRSDPATVTVILGDENTGVVGEGEGSESGAEGSSTSSMQFIKRNNVPLMPDTLVITGPTDGSAYKTSDKEFLIEGNVPEKTHSVWVNGYKLRLYKPGKNFFNYIASVEFSTLKRGRNVYDIIARSEDGYILDRVEYVVTFTP